MATRMFGDPGAQMRSSIEVLQDETENLREDVDYTNREVGRHGRWISNQAKTLRNIQGQVAVLWGFGGINLAGWVAVLLYVTGHG